MTEVVPGYTPAEICADALRQELLIRTLLLKLRTATPVKVVAVHPGTGSPPAIGTVDVQPLVQFPDGAGNLQSLKEVYGVPFLRLQSGSSAVVIDPSIGDIGFAVSCDQDISSVIASGGAIGGPGSARTHHISDLVYIASILSASAVAQYLLLNSSGITMLSPTAINIQAPQININGAVAQTNGNVTMATKLTVPNVDATTDVSVPNGSVNNHVHGGVQTGGGNTGGMTG